MKRKLKNETFIIKANSKHDFKYDYSLVNYVNSKTHIDIICPIHGQFKQRPDHHLGGHGCTDCSLDMKSKLFALSIEEFIKKSNFIHKNKYDYSLVINYKNVHTNVDIICKYHGVFSQLPNNHLNGMGCQRCGYFMSGIGRIEDIMKDPNKSNIKTNLYFVEMSSEDELFYKVGITIQKINHRFRGTDFYKCRLITFVEMGLLDARNEEVKFQENFVQFKYNPKVYFQGHTECFSSDIFNVLFPNGVKDIV